MSLEGDVRKSIGVYWLLMGGVQTQIPFRDISEQSWILTYFMGRKRDALVLHGPRSGAFVGGSSVLPLAIDS